MADIERAAKNAAQALAETSGIRHALVYLLHAEYRRDPNPYNDFIEANHILAGQLEADGETIRASIHGDLALLLERAVQAAGPPTGPIDPLA